MKYIHYCWFGDKPLPKLAKKCIKSWEKFLPDYKIIKWSEENTNLQECPFIKEAYENKKWAFVSDYVRTKALNEMGGIYFDTDMEVTKDISSLFENNTFLGIEDTGYVAVGVWYEKKPRSFLTESLLKKYKTFKEFKLDKINELSIPRLISEILYKEGFKKSFNGIQKLSHDICIYPREYFYPYSYDWKNNVFTDNTCMIHYYDASWVPIKDRIEVQLVRKIGRKKTYSILSFYRKIKDYMRKTLKLILYPIVLYKRYSQKKLLINDKYIERIKNTIANINNIKDKEYLVFYNKYWLGVTSATKELFDNLVDCGELFRKKDIKKIGEAIINSGVSQVIFSSFAIGWKDLAIYLKSRKKDLKIKTYWHGSHSQILDTYGWNRNVEIIKLHKRGIIDVMATCKESLLNFYKRENYDGYFLTNKVSVDVKPLKTKKSNNIKIGLYAAKCDDWRKNMYTQMAAVSLIENAVIDMVPLNDSAKDFAKILGVKIEGLEKPLPREDLLKRMSMNDVNLYVTYSECAPMLPLESMEMGVVCITGNNHHYFMEDEIEKYVVVNNEEDPEEIKDKIEKAVKEREKIITMYKKNSKKNLEEAKSKKSEFLKK